MALKCNLGFGMMRLPVNGSDPTNFDYPQLFQMVDCFLDEGYTYFDVYLRTDAGKYQSIQSPFPSDQGRAGSAPRSRETL